MALGVGSRIGPYEITAPLGRGGMGVVFRARDTRLRRDVALKLLPDHLALDTDRLKRFEREAQLLASLNHPHIAQVYGLESVPDSGGVPSTVQAIAMELVEGETLAERIEARGSIPTDEVVTIARQIALALEAAHERGVVHRDLKPANIKLTPDGIVKVLDFGLAKEVGSTGSPAALSHSPTVTSESMPGVIMGTLAYMSPEQARGKPVDARADIWAFGCVLYEMLTGRQAFDGETATDIIARVVSGEPNWERLPKTTPASLRQLLRVTLTKDVRERLQHIGDTRLFLNAPAEPASDTREHHPERHKWIPIAIGAVLLLAASVSGALYFRGETPAAAPSIMRFEVPAAGFLRSGPPQGGALAISPDGRQIAYVSEEGGSAHIVLRPTSATEVRVLPGTENAFGLFWSPDSRYLAFTASGKLKKFDLANGTVQEIGNMEANPRGDWGADDVIVYPAGPARLDLARVSASGADVPDISIDSVPGAAASYLPSYLPGGHILYHLIMPGPNDFSSAVYVRAIESGPAKQLLNLGEIDIVNGSSPVLFANPGYLLYTKRGTLFAQRFDIDRLEMAGEAVPIAERVAAFTVSNTGVLVYAKSSPADSTNGLTGPFLVSRQLTWVNRSGRVERKIGASAPYINPRLSPDGTRIVVQKVTSGDMDIWIVDRATGQESRLTFDPSAEGVPVWSPDGERVLFNSSRGSPIPFPSSLYARATSGVGEDQLLLQASPGEMYVPGDWSVDGSIAYVHATLARLQDSSELWILPTSGGGKPFRLMQQRSGRVGAPRFSPDGRWIAYTADDTGKNRILVRPFPDVDKGIWQVPGDGVEPVWRRDGKELFYLAQDGTMIAIPVTLGTSVQFGQPQALFKTNVPAQTNPPQYRYDASPDGNFFLFNLLADDEPTSSSGSPSADASSDSVTVVINWTSLLNQ